MVGNSSQCCTSFLSALPKTDLILQRSLGKPLHVYFQRSRTELAIPEPEQCAQDSRSHGE